MPTPFISSIQDRFFQIVPKLGAFPLAAEAGAKRLNANPPAECFLAECRTPIHTFLALVQRSEEGQQLGITRVFSFGPSNVVEAK
jgi:hypothetical protein